MTTVLSLYPNSFENFSVKEIGVKLTPNERLRIRNRLSSLEQRAPAISTISLKYQKNESEKEELNAELSIFGGSRNFSSKVSGSAPFKMYLEMEKKVDKQLLSWKKNRFLNKYLESTSNEYQPQLTGGFLS